ncbi:hypothetical protein HW090_04785 [Pseudomonas sp. ABC1]|uniref:hypothetical protein n=1 Tax=Pseudomonas sp. ABC1 TaxID=2748080 RepID=UPI0015C305D2|nr:hypothetical protein [Pseudomonas sp. ABC1]QLF92538.1 hypothetical protein HW090_04785 [Pseudomonas sp. ABC1]
MKKFAFTLAALSLAVSGAVSAAPVGGASSTHVSIGSSNIAPGGTPGYSGLAFSSTGSAPYSGYADLLQAPIAQATNGVADSNGDRWAKQPGTAVTIAQVWKSTANATADISSLRQVMTPSAPMPVFGGLVIGQVKRDHDANPATANQAYALGQGVYFGEWSPQNSPTTSPSTNLNMSSADRTVWYVGDNAVAATPELVDVEYNVVGIRRTGETTSGYGNNQPNSPDLYTGVLTANYDPTTATGDITGSISRYSATGADIVNFAGTDIHSNGRFSQGSAIEGQFYNGAEALAGIYKGGSTTDHVAFGGSYNGNGDIIP